MKTRSVHRCAECGSESPRWLGRCPACDAWGTLAEAAGAWRPGVAGPRGRPCRIGEVDARGGGAGPDRGRRARPRARRWARRRLGHAARRRAGDGQEHAAPPGARAHGRGGRALPAGHRRGVVRAGAAAGRAARCARRRAARRRRDVAAARARPRRAAAAATCSRSTRSRPSLDPDLPGDAGSVSQVRDCAYRLVQHAKDTRVATVLVGHVTKEGTLAGPRVLEHVVDTVLSFDGDRGHSLRMLHALKHRFGSTNELGPVRDDRARADRRPRRVGAVPRRPAPRRARLRGGGGARRGASDAASRCRRCVDADRGADAAALGAGHRRPGRLAHAARGARAARGHRARRPMPTSTPASPAGSASPSPVPTSRSRWRSPARAEAAPVVPTTRWRSVRSGSAARCARFRSSTAGWPRRRGSGFGRAVVPQSHAGHRRRPASIWSRSRACGTRSTRRRSPAG